MSFKSHLRHYKEFVHNANILKVNGGKSHLICYPRLINQHIRSHAHIWRPSPASTTLRSCSLLWQVIHLTQI